MQRNRARQVVVTAGLAGLAALVAVGCSPTPELKTPWQTQAQMNNAMTITNDTNLKNLNRDLGVLFLEDRPTRLQKAPIAY